MNARQNAFYRQAVSDWTMLQHLRSVRSPWLGPMRRLWCYAVGVRLSFPVCHEIHYLQMCTEKLAKAYFPIDLRTGHAAFRRFIADVPTNPDVLKPLGFASVAHLGRWESSVKPIVGAIEDLAPSIADNKGLPNPEYPWPKNDPTVAPADYSFTAEVYRHLDTQARSGELPFLIVLGRMVSTMQTARWHL